MTPEQLAALLQQAHDDWQDTTGAEIYFQITCASFAFKSTARDAYLLHLARCALAALASPPPPDQSD